MVDLLGLAQTGDERAFADLVAPLRRELVAHCYRLLASRDDAEDAVQEAILAAWRGLASFEGRSSVRAWLYRIATNAALRIAERRPPRMLSFDIGPARDPLSDLGSPLTEVAWVEPWVDSGADPSASAERRESIELAFVAALQQLPSNQRAVLVLRDVLGYSAAESAAVLDTSVASVTSALQRARDTVARRGLSRSQRSDDIGTVRRRTVDAFADAFERGDVPALVDLLTEDVRFTMPPLPAWFDGRDDVAEFLRGRALIEPWRIGRRLEVNGQPALLGLQLRAGAWEPSALMVFSTRDGRVSSVTSFLDPRDLLLANR